jgi:CelD/BcsL family acetyltransferase involved in cellulose biosynthesis
MQAADASEQVARRRSRQPFVLSAVSGVQRAGLRVAIAAPADADARIGAAWDDLALDASEPNAFAERWFFMASVRHLPVPADLRLVAVWEAGRLIGLLPLTIASRYGRMPVRHVVNWLHHHNFLGTPLVRRGHEAAFWAALIGALDKAEWAVGLLHLSGLVEDGPVHRGLVTATRALGRRCDVVHRLFRAQLDAGLDPEAYYEANVRKKKRKELKRLAARLAEHGVVETRRLSQPGEVRGWCDDFLALERSGWKGRAGSALASRRDTADFFCDMLAGAHAAGRLDMLRIDLDGQAVAMLVNFITPPGSFSFKIAFDEDYARFSPGVLVQIENLQLLGRGDLDWMDSCAAENHPMIDSLWGGRRSIVRVTLPLAGVRRGATFRLCRAAEAAWARVRGRAL